MPVLQKPNMDVNCTMTNVSIFDGVPLSRGCVETRLGELIETLDEPFRNLCHASSEDAGFTSQPGAIKKHHVWIGGLIHHTLEVMQACHVIYLMGGKRLNWNVLGTAAVFHDVGKLWDTEMIYPYPTSSMTADTDKWEDVPVIGTDSKYAYKTALHARRIYHVSRSYHEWLKASEPWVRTGGVFGAFTEGDETQPKKMSPEDCEHIAHCILAHHGRLEWNTVKEPQTPEALALHLADMISAKVWNA